MLATPHHTCGPVGYIGRIPVRNIWLLMLYASDVLFSQNRRLIGAEENPEDLADLVAEVLASIVQVRLRNRLNPAYCERNAIQNRVRGRIDLLTTERHLLLAKGKVACRFQHLTVNTPRNRFVRGALQKIGGLVRSDTLSQRCASLAASMKAMGVISDAPSITEISLERFGRHGTADQPMLAAAKLAMELTLLTEADGSHQVGTPCREEVWIRKLFERAVGGFFLIALNPETWSVHCGKTLEWQRSAASLGIEAILPQMRTDIILENRLAGRRIVIDTKFTSLLDEGWYRPSLKSTHLYQLYAYLKSQVGRSDPLADSAEGVLLYPAIQVMWDERITIQGQQIRFATIDLTASADVIREQLLRICE